MLVNYSQLLSNSVVRNNTVKDAHTVVFRSFSLKLSKKIYFSSQHWMSILFGLCSAKATFLLLGTFTVRQWWDCCSGSIRVGLHHAEAEGWISSPAGELFRWWDVDLQLWDLAKANIHLDLSGSIQLCSTPTSYSLPLFFSAFFSWDMRLLNCYFFVFSLSDPPPWLLLTSQEVHCRSRPLCFLLWLSLGLNLTDNQHASCERPA